MSGAPPDNDLTADECIRAGMYWFGRNDFEAARSWWDKALELDPTSERASECLALLDQSTSTGFKSATWASTDLGASSSPFENPSAPQASQRPYLEADVEPAPPPPVEEDEPFPLEPPVEVAAPVEALGPTTGRGFGFSSPSLTTDPLEFAAEGSNFGPTSETAAPNPWDDGPARTSVVTVEDEDEYVAVAEPTPLPAFDRDEYFDRYPRSREEIVDFLRATGDLPPAIDEAVQESTTTDEPLTETASPRGDDVLRQARDKFQLHDFAGVVELLATLPEDHPQASEAAELVIDARAQLLKMYESKVGDFNRTPRVLLSGEEIIWLNLNHRAGFILSQIDGTVTFEDLISLSGMSRLDTVEILAELLAQRVIEA